MPEIKPFRGVLYNSEKVSPVDVVAPPYDVISSQQQNELYEKSPYNIVRLILGRETERYTSAAKYFEQWRHERVLISDEANSIYILSQKFKVPGGKHVERRGFIAACRLEDFGKGSIFPHEKTHSKPKEDRFRLFQATHAMFSQIFTLYSDPNHLLDASMRVTGDPYMEVEFEGVQNRLWKLTDPIKIDAISQYLRDRKIFVADGHHRYETALLYRDSQRLKNPQHTGKEAYNFVPMFLTNMNAPGLIILPTHRLVHSLKNFNQAELLDKLRQYFHLDVKTSAEELMRGLQTKKSDTFGLVFPASPQYILLSLDRMKAHKEKNVPDVVWNLDAGLLHSLIFKKILNLSEESQEKKLNLEYEKDALQTVQAVNDGKAQMAFLMNPTRVEQVRMVAESGFTMPQKSTFFYPKLLSGLVNYSFAEE